MGSKNTAKQLNYEDYIYQDDEVKFNAQINALNLNNKVSICPIDRLH